MTSTAATLPQRRLSAVLPVVVLLFLALRLYFDLNADLVGDEAYYWMWGQHLEWSYFDHPPLHAWLLHMVALGFGWSRFSARLLTWASLALVLWVFHVWSRKLAPENAANWFWRAAALYLASPFYFGMTTIAYNDHLLVAFGLLAIHGFTMFAERHASGAPSATRWLYFAAVALGLATLCKYNGAVIGLGFLAALLIRKDLRDTLRTPHPYLAALLAVAMQAPVIYWNLTEGLASFRFHMYGRWGGETWHPALLPPLAFVVLNILMLSPFLLWPLLKMLRGRPASLFESQARTVSVATMTISSLAFFAMTIVIGGYFYWNILAFVGIIPLLTRWIGTRIQFWLHTIYGLVCAGLLVFNFSVTPVAPLFNYGDRGSSINIDWPTVRAHMQAQLQQHPGDVVAGTRYSTTSQLGFVLGRPDAVPIAIEPLLEYGYWFDPPSLAGKSALILTDEDDGSPVIQDLRQHFANLTMVDDFHIVRFGRDIYRWRIFRGEDYRP